MNILKHQPRTLGQDADLFVLMGGDHDEVGGSMVGTSTAMNPIMKTVLACIRVELYAEWDKSSTPLGKAVHFKLRQDLQSSSPLLIVVPFLS
jgi:hypothetical protein